MIGRATLALLVVVTVGAAACGGDDDGGGGESSGDTSEPTEAVVTVKTFQFGPDPIEVAAGTTVTFVNEDTTTHTATAGTRETPDTEGFDVQLVEDGTGEVTLDEPGTYDYFCSIHDGEGMTGQIVVT